MLVSVAPAAEVMPVGQAVHSADPTTSAYVPAAQSVQAAALAPEYLPAAQTEHSSAPAAEYVPAAQSVQDPEPEAENWPARHCVQVTLALTPLPALL